MTHKPGITLTDYPVHDIKTAEVELKDLRIDFELFLDGYTADFIFKDEEERTLAKLTVFSEYSKCNMSTWEIEV